jgi:hypothetical protein
MRLAALPVVFEGLICRALVVLVGVRWLMLVVHKGFQAAGVRLTSQR